MPTSYGLSYWIQSLPRSEWPTGAFTASARAMTSSCASRTPAPQNSVTVSAALMASASCRTWEGGGTTLRRERRSHDRNCRKNGCRNGRGDVRWEGPVSVAELAAGTALPRRDRPQERLEERTRERPGERRGWPVPSGSVIL